MLDTALIIGQFVLRVIVFRKKKLHNELPIKGNKVYGTVEKVRMQNSVRYRGKSPYIIFYAYTCQGKLYHRKSYLLWDKPDVKEHYSIAVYTDNSGKPIIQL